jgi:hypothetical protein
MDVRCRNNNTDNSTTRRQQFFLIRIFIDERATFWALYISCGCTSCLARGRHKNNNCIRTRGEEELLATRKKKRKKEEKNRTEFFFLFCEFSHDFHVRQLNSFATFLIFADASSAAESLQAQVIFHSGILIVL